MILNSEKMKCCEMASGYSSLELMQIVAEKLYERLFPLCQNKKVLIICGKGNNGGDGLALAKLLIEANINVSVYPFHKSFKTKEAKHYFKLLDDSLFTPSLHDADIIIDAIYGFSFRGNIKKEETKLFDTINQLKGYKISIDINSGCDCDTCLYNEHTFKSDLTLALGAYKPYHLLKKSHHLFNKCECLSLPLPEYPSDFLDMNESLFTSKYPFLKEDAYKGINGKTYMIGGSYGMAGAASLNITGAQSFGCTYIHYGLEHNIYPILASRYNTVVYHPFDDQSFKNFNLNSIQSIGFGSGATNIPYKSNLLEYILLSNKRTVLDAEAIRELIGKRYILKLIQKEVVLTPHIKEFADLMNLSVESVKKNRMNIGQDFAKEYQVTLVLKDVNTVVFFPDGKIYINTIGNQGLARAGSGDVLTGILCASLALIKDLHDAVTMAVWFHSYIADMIIQDKSMTTFDLNDYVVYANKFFKNCETNLEI